MSVTYGNYSYGSGAISDLRYRLPVSVTTYDEHLNPLKGAHVKIKGVLRQQECKPLTLQVAGMEDIQTLQDQLLNDHQMKDGFLPPPNDVQRATEEICTNEQIAEKSGTSERTTQEMSMSEPLAQTHLINQSSLLPHETNNKNSNREKV